MNRCGVCDQIKETVVCPECYARVTGELQEEIERLKEENKGLRRLNKQLLGVRKALRVRRA
jgi:hypothetical protein